MTKILKRPLSILLVVMMVAGLFSAIPMTANAAIVYENNWAIDTSTGLVGYNGYYSDTNMVVPETVAGYTVKGIQTGAFDIDYGGVCALESITFLGHIPKLLGYSFYFYGSLKEVTFEKGVDVIEDGAIAGASSSGFTLTIKESENTTIASNAISSNAAITVYSLAVNQGAKDYAGDNWRNLGGDCEHIWTIDYMTTTAEDKNTVEVHLVCTNDSTHTAATTITRTDNDIDTDDDFTVVSTVEAVCGNPGTDGTMVINTNFEYDSQTIEESNKNVTITCASEHDYSEQKWIWWNNSLIVSSYSDNAYPLTISCPLCGEGQNHSFSLSPACLKTTVDENGFTHGYINKNAQFTYQTIQPFTLIGTVYTDNDYEYYTDVAPKWEWADDHSSATATFIDGTVLTDDDITIDTTSVAGKTRYEAYVTKNGNDYYLAESVDTIVTHTITWKMDDGTTIDTTTVADGVMPTHANPTKAEDDEYTYTFSGWTPEVAAATEDAEYTANFTAVPKHTHTYTPTWTWTENEPSYTAELTLECIEDDDTVVLNGADITYDFNPYCTSYNGIATTYHVHAEYNGVIYEDTKTVPSIDTSNVMDGIALDNIMTTASEAKAQDNNQFGLSDSVYYRNLTVLGVQKKEAIATTDGLNQGRDIRFISVANSELLKNAKDYGFIVAVSGQDVWSTDKQINALTAENFENSMYSCKNTDNQICGDYGKRSTETDYKYVTLAVNGVEEDTTVAARFYVQDNNGVYHYAKYTNKYSKTYDGIAVKYSDLG